MCEIILKLAKEEMSFEEIVDDTRHTTDDRRQYFTLSTLCLGELKCKTIHFGPRFDRWLHMKFGENWPNDFRREVQK